MYISSITKYIDINIIKRRKREIENIFTKYNGYKYEEDIFNNRFMYCIWRFTWNLGHFYFKDTNNLSNFGPVYRSIRLNDITEWGN